jgi:2-polyprenyl-3-methyl-5-hydroxy-6-metoxy-1,4-benzoquinol methylase
MAEAGGLPEAVRERLPDVAGKHVLHVPCGSGEATAELLELGALVTAVDDSIAAAQERAPRAAFVVAGVEELPLQLTRGRFDVVLCGPVLDRVANLDAWAANLAAALRAEGTLVAYDDHPVARCVDAASHWREDYFAGGHRLGEVITAVASAGLVLVSLEELSSIYKTQWRRKDPRVPGQYVLVAEKPA